MKLLLGIGVAGFFGSIARYSLTLAINRYTNLTFPYGTLVVNVVGSFLVSLVVVMSIRSILITDTMRVIIGIGFLGAFTTFSAFSYETVRLAGEGSWLLAGLNVALNVIVCLTATALGLFVGRAI